MGFFLSLLYIFIALASVLVYLIKRKRSYWTLRGIPHDEPHILAGNMVGFSTTKHWRTIMKEYYDKYKGTAPFAGFFFFLSPAVMILDLDLAKNILIKDFNNFADRGLFYNEKDDPLTAHIFNLDGAKWKAMRTKLSPTFTSGKMKFMFPTVMSVGDNLLDTVGQRIQKDEILEVKDILSRFTADVIGTCAFGLDCNSLNDPNAEFHVMGEKSFTLSRHNRLVDGFIFSYPDLARKLRMRLIHDQVHQFYTRVVRETVEYREKNNVKRNDFMNLLIEMKNTANGLTLDEVTAEAFIFFVAGFETSSTTMGFALFELAVNQDIQDKLRAEVNDKYDKNGGKLTYESMAEMQYMEMVIKETLRKYSIVSALNRKALNDYPTSDPKFTIPKGTIVIIPADGIHRDPEIYPDPEKFDPERFSLEETQKRHPTTWLPFGDGPRNCIGLRFGKMQVTIGLSALLRNYKFHYCDKTPNPLLIDIPKPALSSKSGLYLRLERI